MSALGLLSSNSRVSFPRILSFFFFFHKEQRHLILFLFTERDNCYKTLNCLCLQGGGVLIFFNALVFVDNSYSLLTNTPGSKSLGSFRSTMRAPMIRKLILNPLKVFGCPERVLIFKFVAR